MPMIHPTLTRWREPTWTTYSPSLRLAPFIVLLRGECLSHRIRLFPLFKLLKKCVTISEEWMIGISFYTTEVTHFDKFKKEYNLEQRSNGPWVASDGLRCLHEDTLRVWQTAQGNHPFCTMSEAEHKEFKKTRNWVQKQVKTQGWEATIFEEKKAA